MLLFWMWALVCIYSFTLKVAVINTVKHQLGFYRYSFCCFLFIINKIIPESYLSMKQYYLCDIKVCQIHFLIEWSICWINTVCTRDLLKTAFCAGWDLGKKSKHYTFNPFTGHFTVPKQQRRRLRAFTFSINFLCSANHRSIIDKYSYC